jgi:hypothetical protein
MGRRRPLLRPGRYTELFFLDEAVALAAGHRPCAECRRSAYRAYLAAVADLDTASAAALDRRLDAERGRSPRLHVDPLELPDGSFVDDGGDETADHLRGVDRDGSGRAAPSGTRAFLVLAGRLVPWRPPGYGYGEEPGAARHYRLLTPPTTVTALRNGYRPELHPSALG